MIPSEREAVIQHLLQQKGVVTVNEICSHCNCSAETARRDLRRMEQKGEAVRTHGGAVLTEGDQKSQRTNGKGMLEARLALPERADALVVVSTETKATQLLVDRSRRAGIPVIAEATDHRGAVTVVAVDNYQAGLAAGQWVARYAQRHFPDMANVLDVSHPQPNTETRSRGFAEGLRGLSPLQISLYRVNGQGLRESAGQIAADALSVHPDINVIFGVNDDSALGALDAYRAAGLDEDKLLLVTFGLEGDAVKKLISDGTPTVVSIAMFPEIVGQTCIDAAICAFHDCRLPERLLTPYAIITQQNLDDYYGRDLSGGWSLDQARVERSSTLSTGYAMLKQCQGRRQPRRIGFVEVFSSHKWYQNVRQVMRDHTRSLGISLEVVDASQDVAREIDALKQAIGQRAASLVHPGDTIILDAGKTTTYLAEALLGRSDITVITNSLPVIRVLEDEPGITLVASGGAVRRESSALVGPVAERTFRDLRADKAFGCVLDELLACPCAPFFSQIVNKVFPVSLGVRPEAQSGG